MLHITFTNCTENSLYGRAQKVYKALKKKAKRISLAFIFDARVGLLITDFEKFFRFELSVTLHTFQAPGEYRVTHFMNTLRELFSDCIRFRIEYIYGYQLVTVRSKSKNVTQVSLSISGIYYEDAVFQLIYDCNK